MKKYNRGGDQIIECWEDKEIEEWLKEGHGRADLNRMIKHGSEYRRDIEATAF